MNTLGDSARTPPAGSWATRFRREVPTLARLVGFAVLLGAVFVVTLLIGGQVGPIGEPASAERSGTHAEAGQVDGRDDA